MKNFYNRMKEVIVYWCTPQDKAIGLSSIIASFFTTFAIIYLCADKIYGKLPKYSEFIVGLTTFSGYPKQADMNVISLVLLGVVLLYFIFVVGLNVWKKNITLGRKTGLGFIAIYFGILLSVFAHKKMVSDMIVILIAGTILAIPIFWKNYEKTSTYVNILVLFIFSEYSFYGIYSVMNIRGNLSNLEFSFFRIGQGLTFLIVFAVAFLQRKKKEALPLHKISIISQLLLPLTLVSFYHFEYFYEATGENIRLFETKRYHLFLLFLIVCMLAYEVLFIRLKKEGIMLTSILSIGMLKVFTLPKPDLNIDFFHNGEITVPMQQLLSYGKLPYVDFIPIHGFCDYYYSVINYVLFDGSYLSLNAAVIVGNMLMIAGLATVAYFFFEKQVQALILVYLFSNFLIDTAGMRYLFLFITFFVLFSEKVRKSFLDYLWWWVFLSILSIAWNPSIGGSGAIAFLPIVLFRLYKDSFKEVGVLLKPGKEHRKWAAKTWIFYSVLFILGLAFIPIFLKIVVYLKENTATTLFTNGMGIISNFSKLNEYFVPGIITETGGYFMKTFLMVIPLLLCFMMILYGQNKERKNQAIEYAFVLFICFYVITNYAFVRYDNGLRTGVVGVFFSVLILFSLYASRKKEYNRNYSEMIIVFIVLLLCIYQADDKILMDVTKLGNTKGIVEASTKTKIMGQEVEDPIVYVTGDTVDIRGLGNGFITGNSLNSLKNINEVLNGTVGKDGEYVDLTNGVANYVIFDKASTLAYTSGYNISNELMQEKAIEVLKEKNPSLILVAPYIKFDDGTISLRCGKLYDYILREGYKPYTYGNVIYLLKDGKPIDGSVDGTMDFAALMHKEFMQYLPAVWGNSELDVKLEKADVSFKQSVTEDGRVTVQYDGVVSGEKISYIKIELPDREDDLLSSLKEYDALLKGSETDGEAEQNEISLDDLKYLAVDFNSSISGTEQIYHFTAFLYGRNYIIPVKTSPYWTMEQELKGFDIRIKDDKPVDMNQVKVTLYK